VRKPPFFPLAKLAPLGLLSAAAALGATYVLQSSEFARIWAGACLLPLLVYLASCHFRARKMILAEQGRERQIVRQSFIAMVADRSARFWGFLFSLVAVATCVIALVIWAYQAWLWYREGHWVSVTWLSVIGVMPHTEHSYVQRLYNWLSDTNIGVIALIGGLLVAAPVAAISWRSNNKAKFRRNDLANLKKRS